MPQRNENQPSRDVFEPIRRVSGRLVKNSIAALLATALTLTFAGASGFGGPQEGGHQGTGQTPSSPAPSQQIPPPTAPNQPTGAPAPPVQRQRNGQFTISTKVNLVVLPATVVDKKGRRINDLTQTDFQVYENSGQQSL